MHMLHAHDMHMLHAHDMLHELHVTARDCQHTQAGRCVCVCVCARALARHTTHAAAAVPSSCRRVHSLLGQSACLPCVCRRPAAHPRRCPQRHRCKALPLDLHGRPRTSLCRWPFRDQPCLRVQRWRWQRTDGASASRNGQPTHASAFLKSEPRPCLHLCNSASKLAAVRPIDSGANGVT